MRGAWSPLDERNGPRLYAILKSMSYMEKCLALAKLSTGGGGSVVMILAAFYFLLRADTSLRPHYIRFYPTAQSA